jgi:hypothetical protein
MSAKVFNEKEKQLLAKISMLKEHKCVTTTMLIELDAYEVLIKDICEADREIAFKSSYGAVQGIHNTLVRLARTKPKKPQKVNCYECSKKVLLEKATSMVLQNEDGQYEINIKLCGRCSRLAKYNVGRRSIKETING